MEESLHGENSGILAQVKLRCCLPVAPEPSSHAEHLFMQLKQIWKSRKRAYVYLCVYIVCDFI